MASIHDNPPAAVRAELDALRAALDAEIPPKATSNLLIATWNIRSFASLTRKWTATGDASPKRDLRGLRAIIEILSRFDVIAIQEVKGDLRALRDALAFLGEDWAFLMTDVNIGDAGNDERLVFLFQRSRVRPSGLAAEIVIPPEQLQDTGQEVLHEQFVRPPYAVSFQRRDTTFILVTLHVLYGDRETDRLPELRGVANWMADWARRSNRFHHNLLTLGDFNIDRQGSPGHDVFISSGLTVPDILINQPRTIFDDPGDPDDDAFYDQIAWFTVGDQALLDMEVRSGGSFDFMPHLYAGLGLSRTSVSYRISDHYPLWIEFGI
ncbi:endonuclease/exonuclease/phosphatase family protein [Microbulbifer zhoushanensis]|uniref:endonuclease/exonuclease/phosphatase family protein n=1 Tax=Microbulbifer zhoushanensis TaxID=2904254 RepID=UPI001F3A9CC3|nr:endonuclease/exonuclease/phosphatase family protein [Microbulbifer zhoushanensis]